MPITLTINGETAEQLLSELATLTKSLAPPSRTIEWKLVSTPHPDDVRMAADIPPASDFGFTPAPDTSNTFYPEDVAGQPPAEDKPKRKRRTKEEMEAERAAGLPPQEGDPDLEPNAETIEAMREAASGVGDRFETVSDLMDSLNSDILDDGTPASSATATRDDVKTYMSKIIQQRLLTPAELKAIFIERAGGATNAAAMDEKFAADVLAGLAEAAEKKSA